MRSDMVKVICERPRRGGDGGKSIPIKGTKKRLRNEMNSDTERSSEGMKRPYGYNTKEFNEHLNPLRGYIRSCIGRKWDDVYSELCSHINKNNVVQNHILTHVFDFIERNAYIKDGIAYQFRCPTTQISSYIVAIVDDDGTLIENPNSKQRTKYRTIKKSQTHYKIGDTCYLKDRGIFYECTLSQIPKNRVPKYGWSFDRKKPHKLTTIHHYVEIREYVYDLFLRKHISESGTTYGNPELYCIKKRQLNSREIKKLKVRLANL